MSMKEIDNEKATKTNTTRDNVYTIHTTQMNTNKYFVSKPTTTSMRKNDKYSNTQATICAEHKSNILKKART